MDNMEISEFIEATRTAIMTVTVLLKRNLLTNETNYEEIRNTLDKMIKTLSDLKIEIKPERIPNECKRRCRYYNRGYCKFGKKCNFFHSVSVCEMFVQKGICSKLGCPSRHPKDCRHWTR